MLGFVTSTRTSPSWKASSAVALASADHEPSTLTAPFTLSATALEAFQDGDVRVLVTKPSIAGHGMNFQNCSRMAFVGLSDSWESYYQAIRRCYRFGQTEPVRAHIVVSALEQQIVDNVRRKEEEAARMTEALVRHVTVQRVAA